jgi:hypothetical protein
MPNTAESIAAPRADIPQLTGQAYPPRRPPNQDAPHRTPSSPNGSTTSRSTTERTTGPSCLQKPDDPGKGTKMALSTCLQQAERESGGRQAAASRAAGVVRWGAFRGRGRGACGASRALRARIRRRSMRGGGIRGEGGQRGCDGSVRCGRPLGGVTAWRGCLRVISGRSGRLLVARLLSSTAATKVRQRPRRRVPCDSRRRSRTPQRDLHFQRFFEHFLHSWC